MLVLPSGFIWKTLEKHKHIDSLVQKGKKGRGGKGVVEGSEDAPVLKEWFFIYLESKYPS